MMKEWRKPFKTQWSVADMAKKTKTKGKGKGC